MLLLLRQEKSVDDKCVWSASNFGFKQARSCGIFLASQGVEEGKKMSKERKTKIQISWFLCTFVRITKGQRQNLGKNSRRENY